MKKTVILKQQNPITIDDLEYPMIVGWKHYDGNGKGYIVHIDLNKFCAVSNDGSTYSNPIHDTIKDAASVPTNVEEMFVFDTHTELYKWLSE